MKSSFLIDCQRRNSNLYPTWRTAFLLTVKDHGLQALAGYRLGRHMMDLRQQGRGYLLRCIGWPCYYILSIYARIALDIRLDLTADIGPGFYIGHFGNIKIEKCRIGEHCSIAQSTHLRADETGQGPIVGNRVWIGAHAQVVGPRRIEDGATVSAGSVLLRDLPSRALCLGNPARVIISDYDNSEILVAAPLQIARRIP